MHRIVCTKAALETAKRIASHLEDATIIDIESVLEDPETLGDFPGLGLVYEKVGKGIPRSVFEFIASCMTRYDLSQMEHMFQVCVADKADYALKIVEKLCSRIGCMPSMSVICNDDTDVKDIAKDIKEGSIILERTRIGALLYMRRLNMDIKVVKAKGGRA